MWHKSGARRLFISVLAICYGGGGIQHCPRAFDLPKAKSTAGSLGTPIYNKLPINISSAPFIYIYINSGTVSLQATPQGPAAQIPKPKPPFPSTTPFPPLRHRHRPLLMASPSVMLSTGSASTPQALVSIDIPTTGGMGPKGNQASS